MLRYTNQWIQKTVKFWVMTKKMYSYLFKYKDGLHIAEAGHWQEESELITMRKM